MKVETLFPSWNVIRVCYEPLEYCYSRKASEIHLNSHRIKNLSRWNIRKSVLLDVQEEPVTILLRGKTGSLGTSSTKKNRCVRDQDIPLSVTSSQSGDEGVSVRSQSSWWSSVLRICFVIPPRENHGGWGYQSDLQRVLGGMEERTRIELLLIATGFTIFVDTRLSCPLTRNRRDLQR